MSSTQHTFESLLERANRAGYSLHSTDAGYLVARWNMSRTFADLAEVARFLDFVGAAR